MPAAGAGCCSSLRGCFFDRQNEQVDQRCTKEGLLVACVIFSQLRQPKCLRTGLLLLFYNIYQLPGHAISFEFHVSVMNHYYINGLHLFLDGFEWFCLPINSDAKYFPLLSKALWLWINSCYGILLSNLKQKKNVTQSLIVISNHMGIMCIDIPYIWLNESKC